VAPEASIVGGGGARRPVRGGTRGVSTTAGRNVTASREGCVCLDGAWTTSGEASGGV
jgi:hypothetical protein